MEKIKKFHYEKLNRGGVRIPDQIVMCKKIEEIIDYINSMNNIDNKYNTINNLNNQNTNPTFLIPTTKQKIENSLLIIFNEIDKIKNIIYSQIEHKNLSNTHDIWEAIAETKLYEQFKDFENKKNQLEVRGIIGKIKNYIDWEIESLIESNQWNNKGE